MNPTNVTYQVYQIMHEFIKKKKKIKQDAAKTVSDNILFSHRRWEFYFRFLVFRLINQNHYQALLTFNS